VPKPSGSSDIDDWVLIPFRFARCVICGFQLAGTAATISRKKTPETHRFLGRPIVGDEHSRPGKNQGSGDEAGREPPRQPEGQGRAEDAESPDCHHDQVTPAAPVELVIAACPRLGDEDGSLTTNFRAHHPIVPPNHTIGSGLRQGRRMRHHERVPQPTIVLLHGQPDSSASFWALRRELRQRVDPAIRIAVPDRPGYGANPLPATDYAGNVQWLNEWISTFTAGPVLIVGHSWAGGVAVLTAAQVGGPELVGLVLLASIGPFCLLPVDSVLAAPVIGDLISFATLRVGRGPVTRKAASILASYLPAEDTPYAWASGAAMQRRPLWRSFLVEQRALISELPDITAALAKIAVKTQVLVGTRDPFIPQRTGVALASLIPGAQRIEIGGGHDLQLRQPVAVAKQVADLAAVVFDPDAVRSAL
jgi:pimeloyl-ACP methyl ester carboxylesterase